MKTSYSVTKLVLALAILGGLAGCHSAFVNATVTNATDKSIQLFEVDYPNASFGSGQLPAGAVFHYRFKVQGDGAVKITWTDAASKEHTGEGPDLHEGDEGSLSIRLEADQPTWTTAVHTSRK